MENPVYVVLGQIWKEKVIIKFIEELSEYLAVASRAPVSITN